MPDRRSGYLEFKRESPLSPATQQELPGLGPNRLKPGASVDRHRPSCDLPDFARNTQARFDVGPLMDEQIKQAMDRGGIADITTTGRKTGIPRRIEIYFHQFDGDYYLTGRPGRRRDWEANIVANPDFILHLKRGVKADIPVRGETEPDPEVRGRVLRRALIESWDSPPEGVDKALHKWVEDSPFIRFRPV